MAGGVTHRGRPVLDVAIGFQLVGDSGGDQLQTGFGSRVRVLAERYADTMEAGLLSFLRADVQLAHPAAFQVMTGVRP